MKSMTMLAAVAAAMTAAQGLGAQEPAQGALTASYAAEAAKDYAGALSALKPLEADESQSYLYHLRLGWLDYLAGLHAESAKQYRAASAAAPQAVEPLQGLLLPLAASGKTADLLKTHDAILKLDPGNYKSLSQAAWLTYQAKNYKKAVKYYGRAVRLYPSDTEMLIGLGYSQKLGGDKAEAKRNFQQVLLLSPKNWRALEALK